MRAVHRMPFMTAWAKILDAEVVVKMADMF